MYFPFNRNCCSEVKRESGGLLISLSRSLDFHSSGLILAICPWQEAGFTSFSSDPVTGILLRDRFGFTPSIGGDCIRSDEKSLRALPQTRGTSPNTARHRAACGRELGLLVPTSTGGWGTAPLFKLLAQPRPLLAPAPTLRF